MSNTVIAIILAFGAAIALLATIVQGVSTALDVSQHPATTGRKKRWFFIFGTCLFAMLFGYASYLESSFASGTMPASSPTTTVNATQLPSPSLSATSITLASSSDRTPPPTPIVIETPVAPPSTLSLNTSSPKLPLSITCVQCGNALTITLKSVLYNSTNNSYEWAFFVTNKSGVSCISVGFNTFSLTLPDNTIYQPSNALGNWPMGVNQTTEEDAFFANFQPNTRYTLHLLIGSNCGNMIYDNTYQTYDFSFS